MSFQWGSVFGAPFESKSLPKNCNPFGLHTKDLNAEIAITLSGMFLMDGVADANENAFCNMKLKSIRHKLTLVNEDYKNNYELTI